MKPELGPKLANQTRNVSGLEVLASILDLMAVGRNDEAADMVSQRMLAVRMAMDDNHWKRAVHVELAPVDPSAMVPLS